MTGKRSKRIVRDALVVAVLLVGAIIIMTVLAERAEAVVRYYYAYISSTTGCRVYLNGTPYLVWVEHLHTYKIQCRWIP